MDSQTETQGMPRLPATFKIIGPKLLPESMVISGVFTGMFFIAHKLLFSQVESSKWIYFIIFALLLYPAYLDFRHRSNIVVDNDNICRSFFGWKWQKFRWDDVIGIRVLPQFSRSLQKQIRVIVIVPSTKPRFRMAPSYSMGFSDQTEKNDALTMLINHFAAIHKIKLHAKENGVWKIVSHI